MRVGYNVSTDIGKEGRGGMGQTSGPCGPSDVEFGTGIGLVGRWRLGGEVGRAGGERMCRVGGCVVREVLEQVSRSESDCA
jgi:hypothetical protein